MSKVVILGTAHGADVGGKRAPDLSLHEYAYSREICERVKQELNSRGVTCHIDISTPIEGGLNNRVRLVNRIVERNGGASNCIYVSVHNNAAGCGGWKSARGFCVYCYEGGSKASKQLASTFHKNALAMGLKGNRCYPKTGYYTANFAVLRGTTCPAVLTENLFQDNLEDVAFLLSDEGKDTIVRLHVNSILENI